MIGHLVLLCVDQEERTGVDVVDLFEVDFLLAVASALVEGEDAAAVLVAVVLVQSLVLEDHLVDQALVLSEVLFHALFDQRLLDELGGVDRHIVVQELQRVVDQ